MFSELKSEMKNYYIKYHNLEIGKNAEFVEKRNEIYNKMDAYYAENPDVAPVLLKSKLHTVIAECFKPKLFLGNPFYYEMGLREMTSWGLGSVAPSHWIRDRVGRKTNEEHPINAFLEQHFYELFNGSDTGNGIGLCAIHSSFDIDHHTLGYTTLFEAGIDGLLKEISKKKEQCEKENTNCYFYQAAEESCLALLTIAEKFADEAERLLPATEDERQRKFLTMIAQTAKRIPKYPPRTFYEGLCMLLFTRETVATLENIGISQLGHVDRLLGTLYSEDLKAGRISEKEARELITLWMMYTDVKFNLEENNWPETSTCIQLGGCDASGKTVYNHVTRMFIEEHRRAGLVNPKLNCRYSQASPREYLKLIGEANLVGHNNFALINDDVMIAGLEKGGVDTEDARLYVNGGCQETMIEGFGHTEGAALYVSFPRILDLFLRADKYEEFIRPVDQANSFEEFYGQFLNATKKFLSLVIDQRNIRQHFNKHSQPCPLFSVTQTGCIESGVDYTQGGAKYNFSTIAMVGMGTLIDSLYIIKSMVYDTKRLTINELNQVLANNWSGYEELRQTVIGLPKYGWGNAQIDTFASKVLSDLSEYIFTQRNERGGRYIPSLFAYYLFRDFSHSLRATPDGRKDGELISMGCAHSQLQKNKDITAPLRTMQYMDFTVCRGGCAVLDVKLPISKDMNADIFASFVYACGRYGCPTLQPNVVSEEELIDAKKHPERHKNLIVRVSGLSAYFIALDADVQDEIIARNSYRS